MGLVKNLMIKMHKRAGDHFNGMDLLYLTTVGAKSGQKRVSPVARFADGDDAWLVVASNGGAKRNPNWYHNLRAHPDQVWIEVQGRGTDRRAPLGRLATDHRGAAPVRRLREEDQPGDAGDSPDRGVSRPPAPPGLVVTPGRTPC
jgi:deazaflavin-dependent oxidoreductase (nitroreductase family)